MTTTNNVIRRCCQKIDHLMNMAIVSLNRNQRRQLRWLPHAVT